MSECNPKIHPPAIRTTPVAMAFAQSINFCANRFRPRRSHCGRSASSLFHQQRILDAGAGWDASRALVDDFGLDPCNILCMDQSAGMLRTAAQQAAKRGASLRLCGAKLKRCRLRPEFRRHHGKSRLVSRENIPLGAHELARAPRPNGWLLAT